jgi:LmbE family N-acetylglucosaminyl deacetylase
MEVVITFGFMESAVILAFAPQTRDEWRPGLTIFWIALTGAIAVGEMSPLDAMWRRFSAIDDNSLSGAAAAKRLPGLPGRRSRSMSRVLTFSAGARLLVFAPHPDDETLATGELIQDARAAGAAVRVVFATDGDNNPWPQRWCEKRLRIGPAERARWGRRRRAEAIGALGRLGVDAGDATFLGWPDLGLTDALERDDAAIERIAAEMAGFAPTHIAVPSLKDRHPDHAALRVLTELALRRTPHRCEVLGYVVHGRTADAGDWHLARDASRHSRKLDALDAHASQTSLSRGRLMQWAAVPESFERTEVRGRNLSPDETLSIPLSPPQRFWRRHDLFLILAIASRVERLRVALPRIVGAGRTTLAEGACAGLVTVVLEDATLHISFASAVQHVDGYVKLERAWPRLMIFDAEPWRRIEALSTGDAPSTEPRPVAMTQRASL